MSSGNAGREALWVSRRPVRRSFSEGGDLLICLTLALLTAAVYWPVRQFQFTNYDDPKYVAENPVVRHGLTLPGLEWAFTTGQASNWHPVTWLSHMLDCQWFGLDPGAHHLVNLLFHLANTVLLFVVLNRMTAAPWRCAFVAALFALHPLHVESVAWVSERKDVLSTFFWILTVWAYVRYAEQPARGSSPALLATSRRYLLLSLGLYALGLMAKSMLVSLPFVLLLLDYWPLGRTRWAEPAVGNNPKATLDELIWEKLPFLGLAFAASVIAVQTQSQTHALQTLAKLPPSDRVANALVSYARYLGQTFWPRGLAVFYPYENWSPVVVLGTGTILIGITCAVLWRARREPCLVVGWLWFLGMLVPVIGLVQVGVQSMADRYTYLSTVGLFIMVAWGVPSRWSSIFVKRSIAVLAVAVVGICAALCAVQVRYWQNTETLFGHAIEVTKNNWLAHYNLGLDLAKAGKLPEAVEHFEQSVRIKPAYIDAQFNLGLAMLLLGRTQDAIGPFEQVTRLNPHDADAHDNLGLALARLGKAQDAVAQFELALWNRPDYPDAQNGLAWLLATLAPGQGGDADRAVTLSQRACQRTGYRAVAYLRTLAVAYAATGRFTEAVATAQKAIELARAAGQQPLVSQLEALVESFRAGRVYGQPVDTTSSHSP